MFTLVYFAWHDWKAAIKPKKYSFIRYKRKQTETRLYTARYARYDSLPCVAGEEITRNWWQGYDFRKQGIDYLRFGMKQNVLCFLVCNRFLLFQFVKGERFCVYSSQWEVPSGTLLRRANPKFKQRFSDGTLATLQIFCSRSEPWYGNSTLVLSDY